MLQFHIINNVKKEFKTICLEPMRADYLISRDPSADIFLEDLAVSRLHAKIIFKNNSYHLVDLASTSGTLLNNQALTPNQEYPLNRADSISVGSSTLFIYDLGTETGIDAPAVELLGEDSANKKLNADVKAKNSAENDKKSVVSKLDSNLDKTWWRKGEITVKCVKIFNETADVMTFSFAADGVLFDYKAGQFITLILDIKGEEVLRSYSISSSPSRPYLLEVTVKRVSGGKISNWLHDHVKVGDEILIDGPSGKFTCVDVEQPKVLFLSAGSGITPMMSMSRWFLDTASHRDIIFFHNAKTPKDIIFRQELQLMATINPHFQLFVSTTRPDPEAAWLGLQGRLSPGILEVIAPDYMDRTIYVCGPHEFMRSTKHMMTELGFPMQNYYEESFGGTKLVPVKPSEVKSTSKVSFKSKFRKIFPELEDEPKTPIKLDLSNQKTVTAKKPGVAVFFAKTNKEAVCEEEESILDAALREGVKIRSSCRTGNCGTCKKVKLAGEVRLTGVPEGLDESEIQEGFILTCISVPVSRVELDA